jgi:hypothetical protein
MNQHVFRGTEPEFYSKYKEFCIKNQATKKQIIQTPRILQRERRSFRIGIEKGYHSFTNFSNLTYVETNTPVLNISRQKI